MSCKWLLHGTVLFIFISSGGFNFFFLSGHFVVLQRKFQNFILFVLSSRGMVHLRPMFQEWFIKRTLNYIRFPSYSSRIKKKETLLTHCWELYQCDCWTIDEQTTKILTEVSSMVQPPVSDTFTKCRKSLLKVAHKRGVVPKTEPLGVNYPLFWKQSSCEWPKFGSSQLDCPWDSVQNWT